MRCAYLRLIFTGFVAGIGPCFAQLSEEVAIGYNEKEVASQALEANLIATDTVEEEQPVILREGTNMAAALSPDGQTLALDLQGTIWLLPAEGGEATSLTDALGDCHEPTWSPDGTTLAFHSYQDGTYHIWTIQRDGSGLRQMTDGRYDDREPHWSPDGERIAFSSDRNGNYDVWDVALATGKIRSLTSHEANEYHPAYSPDGQHLAYVSEQADAPGLYRMSAQGAGATRLVASDHPLAAPAWNPSAEVITFAQYDSQQSHLLAYYPARDDSAKVISTEEDVFPFRTSWVSDSTFFYTSDGHIKRHTLGQVNSDTVAFTATVTLRRPAYVRKTYNFDDTTARTPLGLMNPVISPDGQSVAFTALGDIWISDHQRDTTFALTDDPYVDIDPAWSPDGQWVAFVSDREGMMNLWVKNPSTQETRRLTDSTAAVGFPVWSPDGEQIAFYTRDARNVWGRGQLHIINVASGKITPLEGTYFVPSKPTWSPDGNTLALMVLQPYSTRYREGISRILLLSLTDSTQRYVSPEVGRTPAMRNANGPVWSPDGQRIAYVQDGVLWQLPVDATGNPTGEPVQLTDELATSPSWTADSQQLVYLATDQLKKLSLATGETTELPVDLTWRPQLSSERYVVHAGRLFDGIQNTYRENVDVIVEGHRIAGVEPHRDTHEVPVIDASDQTMIPGLFEMHTHQHASEGERLGRIWLAYGITSVREPGADPYDALERKEAWASGVRPGPREFFTGGLTDGSRVYYGLANSVIHGPHLELELDRARRLSYDLIKTYVRMSDSVQQRITEAAHALGIPVSSHEIYPATKYNVDAVEHIRGTSRRGYSMKQSEMKNTYDDVIQLLARSQMNITPTIGLQGGFYVLAEQDPSIYQSRQLQALYSEDYRASLTNMPRVIEKIRPGYLANFASIQAAVTDIVRAGGRVTAGTDSPFIPYGTSLHVELQLFVDGGLTPFEALQAATIRAAEAVGVAEDLGSVEAGKLADFVLVDGDPLNNIQDAWRVVSTFKNGIRYDIDDLLQRPLDK